MPISRFLTLIACVIAAAGATIWIATSLAPAAGIAGLAALAAVLAGLRLALHRKES